MHFDGIIQFDESGRLYIDHVCEFCTKFPLENINDPCLQCGCSRIALIQLEKLVNRANKAIDMMSNNIREDENDDEFDVREAFLHLSSINLGGNGMDTITFQDIDMTDDIRRMADLAEHMVRLVIYPTNMRHIEGDDYEFEILFEDGEK